MDNQLPHSSRRLGLTVRIYVTNYKWLIIEKPGQNPTVLTKEWSLMKYADALKIFSNLKRKAKLSNQQFHCQVCNNDKSARGLLTRWLVERVRLACWIQYSSLSTQTGSSQLGTEHVTAVVSPDDVSPRRVKPPAVAVHTQHWVIGFV